MDYNNLKIVVYCFEESQIMLNRAMDNLTIFKRQIGTMLHEKNVELQFHFSQVSLNGIMPLPESTIDIIIANYIIHFIPKPSRDQFFNQMSTFLNKDGVFLMTQFSSVSEIIPHPLSSLYIPFQEYHGMPITDEIKELGKKYFKDVKKENMDVNWRFRKPKR